MILQPTPIPDAYLIELEQHSDERGSFARLWCIEELKAQGIDVTFVQANASFSEHRGTMRGLHYQRAPYREAKLIHCTRGAIFDVLVDMRPRSDAYLHWFGAELSAENRRQMFVPEGCAHGYLTLTDGAEVEYVVSSPYRPSAETGIRYDDPTLGIQWPVPVTVVSPKDRSWPDVVPEPPVLNPRSSG